MKRSDSALTFLILKFDSVYFDFDLVLDIL